MRVFAEWHDGSSEVDGSHGTAGQPVPNSGRFRSSHQAWKFHGRLIRPSKHSLSFRIAIERQMTDLRMVPILIS